METAPQPTAERPARGKRRDTYRAMTSATRRPLSLQARSLLAAGVALAAFLGLTGFALDAAIYETLRSALHDRLQSYAYGYLASIRSVARRGAGCRRKSAAGSAFRPARQRPVCRRRRRRSKSTAARQDNWRSPSARRQVDLPFDAKLEPGASAVRRCVDSRPGKVYVFSIGVTWDGPNRGAVNLTLHIAEDADEPAALSSTCSAARCWSISAASACCCWCCWCATLRWSLRPLRRVAGDLARVERGEQERLSDRYPLELSGLATNLNEFIESERDHLQRYRNTLADLAHSLKTPLAVMRSQLESGAEGEEFRWTVLEQVGRMDQIVAYQLSRAATSGHTTFVAPIRIEPLRRGSRRQPGKSIRGAKYHSANSTSIRSAVFYGEQGDLLELLGNLLENAFKWAKQRVLADGAAAAAGRARAAPGVEIDRRGRWPRHCPTTRSSTCCSAACAATNACRATASAWPSCRI